MVWLSYGFLPSPISINQKYLDSQDSHFVQHSSITSIKIDLDANIKTHNHILFNRETYNHITMHNTQV
eukprot:g23354.t1